MISDLLQWGLLHPVGGLDVSSVLMVSKQIRKFLVTPADALGRVRQPKGS